MLYGYIVDLVGALLAVRAIFFVQSGALLMDSTQDLVTRLTERGYPGLVRD